MMSENVAVLLVDDRPENLIALEAVLDHQGLDLVKALSGNDALRLTLRQDFALVLLDVQMPGMSGFETAELMRANPKTRHLPIIFVTAGMSDAQLQFKGYELGAVDYLIKPFEPHILKSKVKVFCELYRQRRKLELAHQEPLINSMREGYAHCKMLYEGGQPKDFVYLKVNTAFEQLTGLNNVAGRKVSEVISGIQESNPELFDIYGRVAATGNPELFETFVEPLDIWLSISVYSTEKEHFVAVFQNITERKQANNALHESQQKLKMFIEGAPTGIAAFDTEMRYLAVSERYLKQFRVDDTDVIGRSHYEIFPEIPEHWRDIHRRCLAGETLSCDKDPFHRADGSVDWVRWEIRPWHDTSGEIGGIICFTDDVTERMRVEQELLVLNNQLTHEVAKRTSDLSALTAHIQKIAETEKANLARELHDELGSTLVGLSMEIGRLRGKISAPDHLQDLSIIKNLVSHASQSIRGIINQLYPTVLDDCGIGTAVDWLVKGFRKHSGIEVELFFHEEEIDMEHIFALAAYRITQECLTNVAKHSGASKVHIEVSARDSFLDLIIHDNGKGLSGATKTGGHGIFGMIERARFLGGSMEIGSEEGMGTTAHLCLPLAAPKPKNKKRVLVVDDHSIVRNAIRQLLDRETDDFSVEGEASDGNAGIQMAIEGEWDIMLLDINMPKKDGITALKEIKAVKPNLPIIMLSSHAAEKYGEIALSKGAACYIEKGETGKLVEAMRRATLLQ